MVPRTLEAMGRQHGFGLAKRIQQISKGIIDLNQGTLYPALLRLEQSGWIQSRWGTSNNNRRAKFYDPTRLGTRRITTERDQWDQTVSMMNRILAAEPAITAMFAVVDRVVQ